MAAVEEVSFVCLHTPEQAKHLGAEGVFPSPSVHPFCVFSQQKVLMGCLNSPVPWPWEPTALLYSSACHTCD